MATEVVRPSTVSSAQLAGIEGGPAGAAAAGLSGWFAPYREGDPAAYRYLLVLRFAVINLFAVALLAVAWLQGWVGIVFARDSTHLVLLIVVLFAVGLAISAFKVMRISDELNQIKEPARAASSRVAQYLQTITGRGGESRSIVASALRMKLSARIVVVRHIASSLVLLGLLGTVIGFMIALSGVNPETAGDVSAIGPMVSTLINGMSVALSTTLVGGVLNIWLMVNYRLLESGTLRLLTAIVELGERHVQS